MRATLFSMLLLGAAACGGKSPGAAPAAGDEHAMAHDDHAAMAGMEGHEHDPAMMAKMEALPPELGAFHDTLKPLWHAEGADRQANTCKAAGNMLALGEKVQDAGAPDGAAADWDARVTTFMLAIDKLREGCNAGSADFEAEFTAVHQGFHALVDALPSP